MVRWILISFVMHGFAFFIWMQGSAPEMHLGQSFVPVEFEERSGTLGQRPVRKPKENARRDIKHPRHRLPSTQTTLAQASSSASGQRQGRSSKVGLSRKSLSLNSVVGYTGNRAPEYPSQAIEYGWEGTVLLELRIHSEGAVQSVYVIRSSGYELLDVSATQAAKQWHLPNYHNQIVEVPISFELE